MEEIWKPIPGYEGYYEASCLGHIRSIPRIVADKNGRKIALQGRVLRPEKGGYKRRYLMVNLCKETKIIHREVQVLIALVFLGDRPDGLQVCHNDGDGTNNTVLNLRYDTPKNNHKDAVAHGSFIFGERHHKAKLTEDLVKSIRTDFNCGQRMCSLATKYDVTPSAVWNVINRKAWRHVI